MSPKQTLLLVVVGAGLLGGGWYASRMAAPARVEEVSGNLMFPNLATALQGAARIEITTKGKTLVIARQGDVWGVADRGGYRVTASKLREMLTGLTELRIVEPRTSDPEQFARLGLDDPAKPDATATLLRVLDASGKPIVEIITGHRRMRTQGNVPETIYVRRPGENRSFLAEGRLAVDADASVWLDRDLMNIPNSRIASATVTRGDAVLEFARADGKLTLTKPENPGPLDDFRLEEVSRALETLSFQEVKPAKDMTGDKIGTVRFVTTDGLTIDATVFRTGADVWAQFDATGTDAAKDEAAQLANKLRGWAFQLGSWKEKAMVPALDDLKPAPTPPNQPPNQPGGLPPGLLQGLPPGISIPAPGAAPGAAQ
jgi:hypothetical protein